MKYAIINFILTLTVAGVVSAQPNVDPNDIRKIEAGPEKGFIYPYYLYIPPELREPQTLDQTRTILVIPNNTGKANDDLAVHEADVSKRIKQNAALARLLKVAVLMPVFPRPETDWKIYTHALDRDSMMTSKKEYARFDLQLLAMVDDARERAAQNKIKFDKRILLTGFSASGMFANRIAFLHPDRVKGAAIGSPGGWAIAPAASYKGKSLRYPIGVDDFAAVGGKRFDLEELRKVPLFFFLGDKDDNDSLVFTDGYEEIDKDVVFELFGKTPVERWAASIALYKEANLNAEFKLYPNVKHTVTNEMRQDVLNFLMKYAK